VKQLLISTPVGPLGSGLGGGIDLTLSNAARSQVLRGHEVTILAPSGSYLSDLPVIEVPGSLQVPAQTQTRDALIELPANSVLANMFEYARQIQHDYDVILHFAYDWLPFFLAPFFKTPIAHFVSMGSMTQAMDSAIATVYANHPQSIAFCTRTQAATFPFIKQDPICLTGGLDLDLYHFQANATNALAWVGRIAPEKGIEDAIAAVDRLGIPLKVFGNIQDQAYWNQVRSQYPNAPIQYGGFLETRDLQAAIGNCQALLLTSHWVEAFGNVAIEALACGVPVISSRCGGPQEIVKEGEVGFLFDIGDVDGLVAAIQRVEIIKRHGCRYVAEREYSLTAFGDRVERWLREMVERECEANR
jgi:UDP-glucose:tetrahydrobiopterin glucosyltransferase